MPPKVHLYEPKIFGFNIHGKRGSKFFNEPQGTIKYIEDSLQQMEKEKLIANIKEANALKKQLLEAPLEGMHNLSISAKKVTEEVKQDGQRRGRQMQSNAKEVDTIQKNETRVEEDDEATFIKSGTANQGKKNRKKKGKGGQQ